MLKRPGKKAFLELRYLLSVFQDDGVPADQIDTADMRIEIDADAWPVKACRHLLDVRGLAGAVIALHHDAAIDRKSTRLNPVTNAHLVCRLLLEKKNNKKQTHIDSS